MVKPLIGEILLQEGVITESVLNAALEAQHIEKGLIGMILLNSGAITEQHLVKALAKQKTMSIN